ncbi:MAG: hypothetical protein ACTHP8_20085 [Bosea sp. (in: a-proteobacteria)]|uniref:hypothetical protein n=1 Tax=Bosea sp. (in: a-proteobacteria) TaxID=1871050 RepID=UPI003F7BDE5F
MTITAYGTGAYRAAQSNSFVSTRAQFDDLQRQLDTQKKATSYGDLGIDRRVSLDLNGKLSTLDSLLSGIQLGDVNLKLQTNAASTFATLASNSRNDMRSNSYVATSTGRSAPQVLAEDRFKQVLDLLNTNVNGRYLFSGTTSDTEPVESFDTIINGDGAGKAGLKQLIDERRRVDLGSSGLGCLTTGTAGPTTVTLADGDHDYGFKIGSVTSTGTGIAVAAQAPLPAGSRAAFSVSVTGQPQPGDKVSITLNLPDGTQTQVTLTARAAGSTGSDTDSFEIGADVNATTANLKTSLDAAIGKEAQTTLSAASSQVAAKDFFAGSVNNPPRRVPGPDFENATAPPTKVGAIDTTVIWYKGEDGIPPLDKTDPTLDTRTIAPTSARGTATVQVDQGQSTNVGARANEEAFQVGLAQFGIMLSETFPADDPNSQARYNAMAERVGDKLGFGGTTQKPAEIITEFGSAQTAMANAKQRHQDTQNYLTTALGDVENVSTEEVAAQILALQNQLTASYQVTSMLSKLTLTNYL